MALDPITAISEGVTTVINKIFPDANESLKIKLQQATLEIQNEAANALAQIDLNKTEAANPSLFVAGWRPFCGWACAVGLSYSFIIQPLLSWASTWAKIPVPPTLETGTLQTVLMAMLGMAGIRSFDKVKGTDSKGVK